MMKPAALEIKAEEQMLAVWHLQGTRSAVQLVVGSSRKGVKVGEGGEGKAHPAAAGINAAAVFSQQLHVHGGWGVQRDAGLAQLHKALVQGVLQRGPQEVAGSIHQLMRAPANVDSLLDLPAMEQAVLWVACIQPASAQTLSCNF